jgi:hypothetical protein
MFLIFTACAHVENPPCSEWVSNKETKYPAFIESRTLKVSSLDELIDILNTCKVTNIVQIENEIYVVTQK